MKSINDYTFYQIILWKKDGLIRRYHMYYMSLEFLSEDFDHIAFLKFDLPAFFLGLDITDLVKSLDSVFSYYTNPFIILTERRAVPLSSVEAGEYVHSFSCSMPAFREIAANYSTTDLRAEHLLFKLLDRILEGRYSLEQILIRQIPFRTEEIAGGKSCDVVIPHRGNNLFLQNLLLHLNKIDKLKIHVGLDQITTDHEIASIKNTNPEIKFYECEPNPVGPYVIRNWLIDNSSDDLVFFQDSDDIPCADRFEKIGAFMAKHNCQLCGSHELRIDYFDQTVRTYRFPQDVKTALNYEIGHPLFHPSSAISRKAFYQCGKISEERTFGNDTKFLLYSFYKLHSIKNVDEFFYIRRKRPDLLTTASGTRIGSYERESLLAQWKDDFVKIKLEILDLEHSSLVPQKTNINFKMRKL